MVTVQTLLKALTSWPAGQLPTWLAGFAAQAGCLDDWLAGWMVALRWLPGGWLGGWMDGRLLGGGLAGPSKYLEKKSEKISGHEPAGVQLLVKTAGVQLLAKLEAF